MLTAECNSFIYLLSSSHVIYHSLESVRNVILADCFGYLAFFVIHAAFMKQQEQICVLSIQFIFTSVRGFRCPFQNSML